MVAISDPQNTDAGHRFRNQLHKSFWPKLLAHSDLLFGTSADRCPPDGALCHVKMAHGEGELHLFIKVGQVLW